jgi:hypothetical protein
VGVQLESLHGSQRIRANAVSKELENHIHMVAIYAVFYNWTKIHRTLRGTTAMTSGLTDRVWDMAEIVAPRTK